MSKPIRIPRDLKPGDIVVCNHGERLAVITYHGDGDLHTKMAHDDRSVWKPCGINYTDPHRWITAIVRIASAKPKKAKGDKDAKWLRNEAVCAGAETRYRRRRLRAIARRLENMP